MSNIASVFKAEIARIARKEVRNEIASLQKSASTYRAEIAALKRRAQALEKEVRRLVKSTPTPKPLPTGDSSSTKTRFSAKGLASQHQRLGLSAHEMGLLLGTSGQSIYNWEAGDARPRDKYLPAIAALKTLGKRKVAQILASLHPKSD